MTNPNPIDLSTVAAAASWGNISLTTSGAATQANVQGCLSSASMEFLRRTGRGNRNWQGNTASPFAQPVDYSEVYDGNGNDRLMLRNFPVNSIAALTIAGIAITASTGPGLAGYDIDNQGRSVVLVSGGIVSPDTFPYIAGRRGGIIPGFARGIQNIAITYNAGFNLQNFTGEVQSMYAPWAANTAYQTGDLVVGGGYLQQAANSGESGATVPSWTTNSTPTQETTGLVWNNTGIPAQNYTIIASSIASGYPWLANVSVKYFGSGATLTQVFTAPLAGEYYIISPGTYLFNASDVLERMILSYNAAGTPPDIVEAINNMVSLNYTRRQWFGLRSVSMKDVGQTTYTTWALDPSVKEVISYYSRGSLS